MVPMAAKVQEVGRWHPDLLDGEWTVELLETLPDDGLRYELIDGTLLVSPAPSALHQIVAANMFRLLDGAAPVDRAVLFAPVAWQPDGRTSVEPDLLVIAKDRIAPPPDHRRTGSCCGDSLSQFGQVRPHGQILPLRGRRRGPLLDR